MERIQEMSGNVYRDHGTTHAPFNEKDSAETSEKRKAKNAQNPLDFSFKNIQDLYLGIAVRVKKSLSQRNPVSK